MLALTLAPPWGFAVRHLGKPVENRTWPPPPKLVGQRFCIHAGKLAASSPRKVWEEVTETLWHLKAAGLLKEPPSEELADRIIAESSAIVCVATLDRVSVRFSDDPIERDPWRTRDEFGWVLRDLVNIEPVPCRGQRKLWTVPEAEAALVRERYAQAMANRAGEPASFQGAGGMP